MPKGRCACPALCLTKIFLFVVTTLFMLYLPLGDPQEICATKNGQCERKCVACLCQLYELIVRLANNISHGANTISCAVLNALYEGKLKIYTALSKYDRLDYCRVGCYTNSGSSEDVVKEDVDRVIEDELTRKLSDDLLQSVERKFQVDLERSVDMVLMKIKLLLQNGTTHIQDRLLELQTQLDGLKQYSESGVETCLNKYQNETTVLAEKTLHQMVICGYALIGHDPAHAVEKVIDIKTMITTGLKPVHAQKKEVLDLLKVCGHDHDTLKKVIKCVISKSPVLKAAMMDITAKMVDGVVTLTKLMAHGAMHEACLIEVIKTTEDEALRLVEKIKKCVYGSNTNSTDILDDVNNFIRENNATVLDVNLKTASKNVHDDGNTNKLDSIDINERIRRMLTENNIDVSDAKLRKKLLKLKKQLHKNQSYVDVNKIK